MDTELSDKVQRGAPGEHLEPDQHVQRVPYRAVGIWLVIGAVLLGIFYAASAHVVAGNSDGATVVLEGQSMSLGHLLLHGWSLSVDSFWSVDAIVYAVAVLVAGVHPELMDFVPALIAAVIVCLGIVLAREQRKGAVGVVGPLVVFALLALPSPTLTFFLLQGPLHIGTTLWCLIAFLGVSRNRFGWGFVLATLLLAAGLLGDLQMAALGVAPVFLAGLVAMARLRNWRAGLPCLCAALGAALLALLGRKIIEGLGAFSIGKVNSAARPHQMLENLRHLPNRWAGLLGVTKVPIAVAVEPTIFRVVHIVALLVVLLGIVAGIIALVSGIVRPKVTSPGAREAWRLDDLLVLGFVCDIVVFVTLPVSGNGLYARYLTASVIFGAILAGHVIGRAAGRQRPSRFFALSAWCGVAAMAIFAIGFVQSFTNGPASQPARPLGQFLAAHHLSEGIGDYWSSSIVTVETDGLVAVRPVVQDAAGRIVRYTKQSEASWYEGQSFDFLVFNTARPWGRVDATSASTTFGSPVRMYVVGTYRVLVWSHALHLSILGATWY